MFTTNPRKSLHQLESSFSSICLDETTGRKHLNKKTKNRFAPNETSIEFSLKQLKHAAKTARKNFAKAAIRGEKKLHLIYSSKLKSLNNEMVEKRMKKIGEFRFQETNKTPWTSFEDGYLAKENREIVRIEGDRSRSRHRLNEQWRKFRKQTSLNYGKEIISTGRSRLNKILQSLVKELEKYELHDVAREILTLSAVREKTEKEYLRETMKAKRAALQISKNSSNRQDQGKGMLIAKREKRYMLELPRLQKNKTNKGRRNERYRGLKTPQEKVTALLSYQHSNPLWNEIQLTAYTINTTRPYTFSYFNNLPKQKLSGKSCHKDARRRRRNINRKSKNQ